MTDLHSNADAYVVGALSPAETLEFETHLEQCANCREEVAEMRELAAQLSHAVATEPPPALRGSILDLVAATPQQRAAAVAPGAHRADISGAVAAPEPSNVVPLTSRRPNRAASLLAAASLVVAASFGALALKNHNDAQDAQQVVAQSEQLTQILAAGDARTVTASVSAGGSAIVVMSPKADHAVLVASDLPELPDGKVYEAWTIKGSPRAAGTFAPGDSPVVLALPDATFTAAKVAVTIEPEGGSEQPTGAVVASLDLPQA